MIAWKRALVILSAAVLLASCAPAVVYESTLLTPEIGKSLRLARAVDVRLSTGYSTTLRAGTRWERVGTIPQGYVRLNISMGLFAGHVYGELVDEARGQAEIADVRYTGSATTS